MPRCARCTTRRSRVRCPSVRSPRCTPPAPGRRSGVADLPSAVTDTHALVFHAAGGGRLGARAKAFYEQCERQQAILYVPMAVVWECSLLARVSRINLRRTVREFFDDLFSNPAFQPIDITPEEVFVADELRFT